MLKSSRKQAEFHEDEEIEAIYQEHKKTIDGMPMNVILQGFIGPIIILSMFSFTFNMFEIVMQNSE